MLQALDVIAPGVPFERHPALRHDGEILLSHLQLNNSLETKIQNMFTMVRPQALRGGLIQAFRFGRNCCSEILKREKLKLRYGWLLNTFGVQLRGL